MRPATDAELVEHRRQAEGLWTVAEAVQVCSDYRQSRHDPRIAVIYGEWATTLDQRNAVAWTARAAAHRNARQVTEAVSAAQESVTLEPDVGRNPHGHTTLLAALVDSGPPPQDLTERLEALGEDKFAQNAAGRALAALGELERAEACFRRAIAHGHRGREPLQGLRELVGEYRARGDERSAVRLEGYLAAIAAPASA